MKRKLARKQKRENNPETAQSSHEIMLELSRKLLDPLEYSLLLEELQKPLLPAIRINRLKSDPSTLIKKLSEENNWKIQPVPYCSTGWFIESGEVSISQCVEHRLGYYYIQDAASMLPVELFDFNTDEPPLILDMAASPGGKTTHLIDRSLDQGLVIANDSSADRITALRLVLQTWGAMNVAVTHFPGEYFGVWFPGTFDRVLLDAPCSMQNLRSTENRPVRSITPGERDRLAKRQVSLLESAIKAVKVGGQVVYSTCTLSPQEDEAVLDDLINKYGSAIQIEESGSHLITPAPGLLTDGERIFNPEVQRSVRLFPHRYHTSGFFAALITKRENISVERQDSPDRPFTRTRLKALDTREKDNLLGFFNGTYGFDLKAVLETMQLSLFRREDSIYALPNKWLNLFEHVPFQSLGLLLCENFSESYIPSHELVTRFGLDFQKGYVVLSENQVPGWLHGEDIHTSILGEYSPGEVVSVRDYRGSQLGRGKVLTGRLKNLLPRRLIF
jgi:16S rRNA (cytosine1407-C5)-methyltransferase